MFSPRRWLSALALGCLAALPIMADTAITPVPAHATRRAATIQVRVALDHPDWNYQPGETPRFRVEVTADNSPLADVPVDVVVGPELIPTPARKMTVPATGLIIDGGTLKEPGFIRCVVSTTVNGHAYRGVATAGFSPEKITPYQTEPADFDAFWAAGKAELAKIPIEPILTLLPEASTGTVNVYHVSFRNVSSPWMAVPGRMYGILCEPKAPGKYPALLRVPGAGVRPYQGDKDIAARGCITLEIGVHGIPVNMPQSVYDQLFASALEGYWGFNLDDRDRYYFRRVVLGCVRANDFLTTRDNWDGKRLMVAGASQGGFLAIATTALDPRVTSLAVTHPALCDLTASLHGRAGGWPQPFQNDPWTGAPSWQATPAKIATSAYYDTVNFARRVKVPGHYLTGYNDEVCPPTSVYAAYNVIPAPKELTLMLEIGHAYPPEQYEVITAWMGRSFGLW